MKEQVVQVLLGAVIASIVPIYTLFRSARQWKLERRIEFLKTKHDRLEKIYTECLEYFNQGLQEGTYSSNFTSSLHVYGSSKARQIFDTFMACDANDVMSQKSAYLNMAIAAKEHLVDIDHEIEKLLS